MSSPAEIVAISAHFKEVTPATTWSFVRVRVADGVVGWGEATINGRAGEIGEEVRRQATLLTGRSSDPLASHAPVSPGRLGWAVVSAIDQALWDIAGKRAGESLAESVARYAGGSVPRKTIPLYANVNRGTVSRTPSGFAASADAAASAGFAAVKMAPFDGMSPALAGSPEGMRLTRAGLDCIAAAHQALAGRARLMVDCHWRFTPDAAVAVLKEIARIGVVWFECPIPEIPENVPEVKRLRGIANAAGVQLAGMEEASLLEAFLPWADCYDVMMPDVKYAGGLAETLRIADALTARGVRVSLHNPTGSVCHAVSLQMSAVLPSDLPMEIQWGETDLLFDLPSTPLPRPHEGASALPVGPGHGALLALDASMEGGAA